MKLGGEVIGEDGWEEWMEGNGRDRWMDGCRL